jgi:predicted ribosome quality control (RQC) complex YloA/Tae2 family protein
LVADYAMALTAAEIEAVLLELTPAVRHGWIQKIHQPASLTLVFEIRAPGKTHRLLVSCHPDTARLHLIDRGMPNPPTPPAFCQFLRAYIQGARIDDVRQIPNHRIVEFYVTAKDGPRRIVCELTGASANVLVLDTEGRILRDLAHQRDRIGELYVPPERKGSVPPEHRRMRFTGSLDRQFPLSAEMDAHYRNRETAVAQDAAREARRRVLKKAIKKMQRQIDAWHGDLVKANAYREYARYGELIKANLAAIPKGADRVTVIDYFDKTLPEVTIPLDSAKSAHGNMDDYFRKHRKFLAAEQELPPRIDRARQELSRLREELALIEAGTWVQPVPSGSDIPTAPRTFASRRRERGNRTTGPFRQFTSTDGLPIFVGRNARENDELTFKLAKSDDLWLHARGVPGSHVIVRLEKGKEPPPETLRDAAVLALLYSDLKKSGKGDVIYTRRKWVKKAKGQAPGAVLVTQDKSLHVAFDRTRLDALKARSLPEQA